MIKRLIFDVDGTLIDGGDFIGKVKNILRRNGLEPQTYLDNYLKSTTTYEDIYDNYNKEDYTNHFSNMLGVKLDKDKFTNIVFDEIQYCIPDNNDKIKQTLEMLSKKYELVILTNYFSNAQLMRLKNMGIDTYFKECHGQRIIKDNKEAFMDACGKYTPKECVMIGDNPKKDIQGAIKCGLHAIYVNPNGDKIENSQTINSVKDLTVEFIENLEKN